MRTVLEIFTVMQRCAACQYFWQQLVGFSQEFGVVRALAAFFLDGTLNFKCVPERTI